MPNVSLTLKHWENAHSVNYFSYIAVRTLTAFLNSAKMCEHPLEVPKHGLSSERNTE